MLNQQDRFDITNDESYEKCMALFDDLDATIVEIREMLRSMQSDEK